ncbi:hypothetical protein PpBr36_04044 [Pyricularia pennisetigena]|uniref:hypothetical protein n=1 Tax=Pyricularia pennisetigena TaxID=1578925 RepID=UPI001152499B|nr:hypothetical protein PpBr36_04044 [Pyricularia pennisetigena]TLS27376.1 hypothetical protein PpBr36_04044 [Pyricularia pennisetigena]
MASSRLFFTMILSLLLLNARLAIAKTQDHTSLTFANITGCAASCLHNSTTRFCTVDDALCLCTSPGFIADWNACTHSSCSPKDVLTSRRVQAAVCHFDHPDKTGEETAVALVLFVIVALSVALRLASRRVAREFFIDDVLIYLATVTSVALLVPHLIAIQNGFGKHYYDLPDGAMTRIVEPIYILENFYIVTLTFIRISILCLYLRLFYHFGWFRALIIGTILIVVIANGTVLVLTVLSCRPIERIWDTPGPRDATCMDVHSLSTAVATLSTAEDFLLLLLPLMPMLVDRLNRPPTPGFLVPLRSRAYVIGMFAVGALAATASAYRLDTLLRIGESSDPSWDYVPVAHWSLLEFTAGVVAACLPAIRTLAHIVLKRRGITWLEDDDEETRGTVYYIRDGAKVKETSPGTTTADPEAVENQRISKQYKRASWVASSKSLALSRPAAVYCHPAFDGWEESEAPSPAEGVETTTTTTTTTNTITTTRHNSQGHSEVKSTVAHHVPRRERKSSTKDKDAPIITVTELEVEPVPGAKKKWNWRAMFQSPSADRRREDHAEESEDDTVDEPPKDWRHSNWG